jgi:hypothetical protein
MSKRLRNIILFIVVINVGYSVFLYLRNQSNLEVFMAIDGDGPDYYLPAQGIVKWGSFSYPDSPDNFVVRHTPLYPFLLVPGVFFDSLVIWAILLNIIALVIAVIYIFKIGQLLKFARNTILLSLIIFGLSFQVLRFSSIILTENTFIAILMVAVYHYLKSFNRFNVNDIAIAAIMFTLATFTRPITLYLLPVLFVLLIINLRLLSKQRIISLTYILMLIASFFILTGLWTLRNERVSEYRGFTAVAASNWYSYFAAHIVAEKNDINEFEAEKLLDGELEKLHNIKLDTVNSKRLGYIYSIKEEMGKAIVFENALTFSKLLLTGIAKTIIDPSYPKRMLGPYSFSDNWPHIVGESFLAKLLNSPYQIYIYLILTIINTVFLFLFIIGMIRRIFISNERYLHIVVLFIIFYFIFLGGFHGLARFRYPIMGIYLIYAIDGLSFLVKRLEVLFRNKVSSNRSIAH